MVPASLCHRLPALHTEIDLARDAAQGRLRDSRAAGQPPSCVSAWRLLLRAGHLLTLPHAAGAVAPATRREAKPQPLTLVQLRLEVLDLVGDGKQPRQRPSTPLQLARHPVRREVRASPLICIAQIQHTTAAVAAARRATAAMAVRVEPRSVSRPAQPAQSRRPTILSKRTRWDGCACSRSHFAGDSKPRSTTIRQGGRGHSSAAAHQKHNAAQRHCLAVAGVAATVERAVNNPCTHRCQGNRRHS